MNELGPINSVISLGYCIGCGSCAAVKGSPFVVSMNDEGYYHAVGSDSSLSSVCPFADGSLNEDILGRKLFGDIAHDEYLGYHLESYAGSVKKEPYRMRGTSGGMATWLSVVLLEESLVDYVIHVKPSSDPSVLFSYGISSTKEEIIEGASSKYYPVEMSKVLEIVRDRPGRYLLVGVPCFIKAVRLLSEKEPLFKERIVFTIGIVCGHLKSDRFAKSIGWELGVHPSSLKSIEFRKKLAGHPASYFGVSVVGDDSIIEAPMDPLIVSDWGHGLFRYQSCDYCDDVLAETADVTFGDAWLPEYEGDYRGNSIIVVRNSLILSIIEKHIDELDIKKISSKMIYQSQAAGFRHRRDGLSYRLFLKDLNSQWRPAKRVEPSDNHPEKRKKIYKMRSELVELGNRAFEKAIEADDFSVFKKEILPALKEYDDLYS